MKGFTLIEVLVVILIIGILASVALPQYRIAVAKARYTEAISMADAIYKAQQIYYMENGERTYNWEDLDLSFSGAELSEGRMTVSDVVCVDMTSYSWQQAYVNCTTKDGISYRKFYADTTPPLCLAQGTNEVANRVCKTMSSQAPFSWDGGITNYYYIR